MQQVAPLRVREQCLPYIGVVQKCLFGGMAGSSQKRDKRQETPVISNSNPLISLVLLSHREFVSDTILVESAALEPVDFIEKNG